MMKATSQSPDDRARRSRKPATPLRVICTLASDLAGDVPHLDAILEQVASMHFPGGVPRGQPVPRNLVGTLPIPIRRKHLAGLPIPLCSSGIVSEVRSDQHSHFTRSIAAEDFSCVDSRRRMSTTGGVYRSYRLPLRVRTADQIVWFCVGWRRDLLHELKHIQFIGKKNSQGFGRVVSWEVEHDEEDRSWYASGPGGRLVLMRPLPVCDEVPNDLLGARRWHGGCCPPYWQKDLHCEIWDPC